MKAAITLEVDQELLSKLLAGMLNIAVVATDGSSYVARLTAYNGPYNDPESDIDNRPYL